MDRIITKPHNIHYQDNQGGKMIHECPGVTDLKTPSLSIQKCPQCGEEIEIFSNEVKVTCNSCGFIISNEIYSSVK